MDRLEAMSFVLAVAETGSLQAAARRLKTPVATASRKISELEAHLRTKLFDRSGRRLSPTDAGITYLAASKRILAEVEEAERTAAGEYAAPTGELTVTATVSLGRFHLVPIVAEFLQRYPDISVRLILEDRTFNLPEANIDVAVRIGHLPDSRLIALRLGAVRRLVCASPSYLAARGTPRVPEEIAGHACIVAEGFAGGTTWAFVRDGTDIAVEVQPRLVVSSPEAACDAARAGFGLTRVPSVVVSAEVESGMLETVLNDYQSAPVPINLLYAADRFLPVKLRAFLDFAVPRLKARLAK